MSSRVTSNQYKFNVIYDYPKHYVTFTILTWHILPLIYLMNTTNLWALNNTVLNQTSPYKNMFPYISAIVNLHTSYNSKLRQKDSLTLRQHILHCKFNWQMNPVTLDWHKTHTNPKFTKINSQSSFLFILATSCTCIWIYVHVYSPLYYEAYLPYSTWHPMKHNRTTCPFCAQFSQLVSLLSHSYAHASSSISSSGKDLRTCLFLTQFCLFFFFLSQIVDPPSHAYYDIIPISLLKLKVTCLPTSVINSLHLRFKWVDCCLLSNIRIVQAHCSTVLLIQ